VFDLRDPLGSMGDDSALAVLSDKPRMLYDYFKQLFAQVSNPAIDSIREKIIMSLKCYIGPEQNLLTVTKHHAERLLIDNPIITNAELAGIKNLNYRGWKTEVIDITFDISPDSTENLEQRLDIICQQAEKAIVNKSSLIVLSDRESNQNRAAISSLMACGAVHHHLVKIAQRTQIGIVLETGEAREVHHFCTLFGYGADAINPYLAYEALIQARNEGYIKHSHDFQNAFNRCLSISINYVLIVGERYSVIRASVVMRMLDVALVSCLDQCLISQIGINRIRSITEQCTKMMHFSGFACF
jgi:glutamate synthase (NADPH/NADH) large chain